MVSDFIGTDTSDWNRDLVAYFFTPEDFTKILNTRIRISCTDRFIWPYTKAGIFSVKSCSKLSTEW